MNAATWFNRRGPALSPAQLQRRARLPAPAALDPRPLGAQRLVVVDLETSGLNPRRDQLLSIGAVLIEHAAIDLGQQFECTLHCPAHQANASTLIHGIGPAQLAHGRPAAEALLDFMEFVGDSPLLAFHAGFDRRILSRALHQHLGYRLQHPFFDMAELAPLLCPQASSQHAGLDHWSARFGLQVQQRHQASADALVTAELALILFSKARQQDLDSLPALAQRLSRWRRRPRAHSL